MAVTFEVLIPGVPYFSQWTQYADLSRGDCGIASICSVAGWMGIDCNVDDVITMSGLPYPKDSYTFAQLIHAGASIGVNLSYEYPMEWTDIRAELDAGRPVISLLKYGDISGNQDTFTGAHFWTVVGYNDTEVIVNDSNWWGARINEGNYRHVSLEEFKRAIGYDLNSTGNMAWQGLVTY